MIRTTFLFLFLLGSIAQLRGQLALNSADMPDAPSHFVYSIAVQGSTTPPLSKDGQGVTWDYSDMDRIGQRIDSFFQVSNTPTAYRINFDNPFDPEYQADHALRSPGLSSDSIALPVSIEDRYDYYKEKSSGYELVGFGARINGLPASTKFDPKDVVYPMPLQYGVSDSSYARLTFDAIPNFYYEQERWRTDTVDGEGTLITPFDTYSSCLRVKTHLTIRDSLKSDSIGVDTASYRPEKVIYEWFSQGEPVPVLRIVERGGLVNRVEYRDTLQNTSLNSHREKGLRIYPNPSSSKVHIEWGEQRWERLELRDIQGKRILERSLGSGSSRATLDLTPFAEGVYILRLQGESKVLRRKVIRD